MTRNDLERAYRHTTYRVFLPGGCCELRVGTVSELLRDWLQNARADGFALLTAHNPGSRQCPAEENAARQAELECELLEAGFEPYAAESVADDALWPVEEGCFVTDLPLDDALALAEDYGQNALLFGGADACPRLVWVPGPA
jgi:hypothetical protein